jgi:plastocyanin
VAHRQPPQHDHRRVRARRRPDPAVRGGVLSTGTSRFVAGGLLAAALLVGACGGGDSGGGGDAGDNGSATTTEAPSGGPVAATILLQPATFKPEDVKIKVGETVRWKWGGGVQHDVEGDGFESKLMAKGQFDHTFDTAGVFPFKCTVHPTTMKGTVTVEA